MSALADYWRGFARMGRDARLWVACWALISFGGFGVQSVLLNLYLLRLGYDPKYIGLLQGLGQLMSVIMCLPGVAIGRKIGHRNAMLASAPLVVLSTVIILLSENLPQVVRPTWLVGSWMLGWTGIPIFLVNSDPCIMRVTTDDTRRYAFASQAAAVAAAAFGGALIAGWLPEFLAIKLGVSLANSTPYRTALILVPIAYTIFTIVLISARREPALSLEETTSSTIGSPLRILVFIGILMFIMRLGSGVTAFFNVYLDDALAVPTFRIGALMGVAELVPIVLAMLIPLFLSRWGAGRTLGGAAICTALAMIVLALVPNWYTVGTAYVIAAVAWRVHFSTRVLFSQQAVESRWRGVVAACVEMGSSLGMVAATSVGGYLIVTVGYHFLFLAAAGVSLLSVAMLSMYLYRVRKTAYSG